MTGRQRSVFACHLVLLLATAAGAAASSRSDQWQPVGLVALLAILCVGSELLTVEIRRMRISGSFLALVLALSLLGPAPAAAIGALSMLVDAVVTRLPWSRAVQNVAVYTAFPVAGGLLMAALGGAPSTAGSPLAFPALLLVVFMATNALNFGLVACGLAASGVARFGDLVRSVYLSLLPAEFAMGLLAAGTGLLYQEAGVGALGLLAMALFVFQYLARDGIAAFERGEQLEQRSRELASLHFGLIAAVLQTLSMRDAMTARHSAAVARYALLTARELGLPVAEQELVHTAGLFHDIGKVIFPDSILTASRRLTDEEWAVVRRHPEQGARLIRRIEGYGPVADIVQAHHERVDGRGYPHGLTWEEIPLGSRILAVADVYDVMTGRDSYRTPVRREAAVAELRRVAGSQLDPGVVEAFVAVVERGAAGFRHTDHEDFEAELAFERRVEAYARPRAVPA
jgi:putative nucleotidyltransferase with HDIG domain